MATKTDKQTGEITLVNPYGGLTKSGLILPTPTYSIRNNCQLGQWVKSDGVTPLGKKLEMAILHTAGLFGDLGKTKASHWLQIWAISEAIGGGKIVFCTYVKGTSLTILGNTLLDAAMEGKGPQDITLESDFIPKSNEYGSYFTLGFTPKDRPQDDPKRSEIEEFLLSAPIFCDTNLPPTIFNCTGMAQEEMEAELDKRRKVKAA